MSMGDGTVLRRKPFRFRFGGRLSGAGLAWRIGALASIPAALFLSWLGRAPLPPCLFRNITGLSCPTCGATRAFHAAAHGEIMTALGLNPAGTVLFLMLPLLFLRLSLEAMTGRTYRPVIPRRFVTAAVTLLLGLWLAFGATRLVLELSALAAATQPSPHRANRGTQRPSATTSSVNMASGLTQSEKSP